MTGTTAAPTTVTNIYQTEKSNAVGERLQAFMDRHVYPNEQVFYEQVGRRGGVFGSPPIVKELQARAREAGLWNLFLHHSEHGLSNVEFAPLCEIMTKVYWSQEVFNCAAPDTGNMETLAKYGTPAQKQQWLAPLLNAEIRSCFAMTEPGVASSDATNIRTSIRREGDEYVINGSKWWSSGASDPECQLLIVLGRNEQPPGAEPPDRHHQHSMILVPSDAKGLKVLRNLSVFGYEEQPRGHGEIVFDNVRVPAANLLLGEGKGFEIAQGRLGPGRIHYGMRCIGLAERALELMCERVKQRTTFGKLLSTRTVTLERIAEARIMIDQTRLLVLHTAHLLDQVGNKAARKEIAMIKVAAPNMACKVIDWAIQAFGGEGLSAHTPLAYYYSRARLMRIADGPDEVHRNQIGKLELASR